MAFTTVLQNLVVKLIGDDSSYQKMVKRSQKTARSLQSGIERSIDKIGGGVDKVFLSMGSRIDGFGKRMQRQFRKAPIQAMRLFRNGIRTGLNKTVVTMNNMMSRISSQAKRAIIYPMHRGAGGRFTAPGMGRPLGVNFASMRRGMSALAGAGMQRALRLATGVGNAAFAIGRGFRQIPAQIGRAGRALRSSVGRAVSRASGWVQAGGLRRTAMSAMAGARTLGRGALAGGRFLGGGALAVGRGALGAARMGLSGLRAAAPMLGRGAMMGGRLGLAGGMLGLRGLRGGAGMAMRMAGSIRSGLTSAFSSASSAASNFFSVVSTRSRMLGRDISYIGRNMSLFLTAPIAAFSAMSVKAFAAFDDAMHTSIAFLGGVTDEVRRALEQNIFDISAKTRTAPTDLALGYYHLASAGYDAAQSLKAVGVVEQFAIAGAFDLNESGHAAGNTLFAMGRATEYLTGVQSAMGLRVEDSAKNMESMVHIGDVLTKANQIAKGTVEDFAKALTNKGASALRMLGQDLESGVAILAAYAHQNVKAEAAGEKLYVVLRDLQRAAVRKKQAWDAMGLSVFDVNGKMLPLVNIITQLEKKLGTMSDEEKRAAFLTLGFQDRSLAATMQLLGMSDAIRQFESRLRTADGAMEQVSGERLKSFTSQMKMFKNQVTIAAIEIGKMLAPSIMVLNKSIASLLKVWVGLSAPVKKFIVFMALLLSTVGPLLVVLGLIVTVIGSIGTAFTLFTGVLATIVPFLLYFAGFASIIAGITAAVGGTEGFVGAWEKAKEAVNDFLRIGIGFIHNFETNMQILFDWLGSNWGNIFTDAGNIMKGMYDNMSHNTGVVIETMIGLFSMFMGWLGKEIRSLFSYIEKDVIGKGFSNAIKNALSGAMKDFMSFSRNVGELLAAMWTGGESLETASAEAIQFVATMGSGVLKDMVKGWEATDISQAMLERLQEGMGKLTLGKDFKLKTTPFPGFKFDIPEETIQNFDSAIEGLVKVHEVAEDLHEELEQDFNMNFTVSGIEAIRAGSIDAMVLAQQARNAFGVPIETKGAVSGGVAAAFAAGMSRIGASKMAKPTGAEMKAIGAVEAFKAGAGAAIPMTPELPSEIAAPLPFYTPPDRGKGIVVPPRGAVQARQVGATDRGITVDTEDILNDIRSLLTEQTENEKSRPIIEFSPANL